MSVSDKTIYLIYDKECPMCNFYCNLVRIKKFFGNLVLLNAREDCDQVQKITQEGLDIDQGMVLIVNGVNYYADEAINILSLLSSRSNLFNRLNYHLFKSRQFSKWLYPVLRTGRNLILKLLSKTKINNLQIKNNGQF